MDNFYLKAVLVFFVALITDAIWTYYIKHTSIGNAWRATISSSLIVVASAFITVEYVNNPWMVLVAAVGGGLGTFILMKLDVKKEHEKT
jgi:branched-subunit amino acid ABC-type transport system permease component